MYAVIETGGKQYRVEVGTELEVELLEVEAGASMTFDRVLLVADGKTAAIGRPVVTNAQVAATVIGRGRGEKTVSFKYRPKARSRVKKGHRQELTLLRISDIVLDGHSAAADVKSAQDATKRDRVKLEEAARRQAAADAELAAKLAAEKPVKVPAKATAAKATTDKAPARGSTAQATDKPAQPASAKGASAKGSTTKGSTAKGSTANADTAAAERKPATKKITEAKAPAKRATKRES